MIAPRFLPPSAYDEGDTASRWLAAGAAAIAFGLSVWLTASKWHTLHSVTTEVMAVGAFVLVAIASALTIDGVLHRPSRLAGGRLWLVLALAVLASTVEYLSALDADAQVRDDFGPVVVGLLLLAAAPFCTPLALITASVLATAIVNVLILGAVAFAPGETPLIVPISLVMRTAIVLALAAAAAAYSRAAVTVELHRRQLANTAALDRDAAVKPADAASARTAVNRVTLLRTEVLPFLDAATDRDQLEARDIDRARTLFDSLQHQLRRSFEATWLDDIAERNADTMGVTVTLDDPTGSAASLQNGSRSATAELLGWLAAGGRARTLHVALRRDDRTQTIRFLSDDGAKPPTIDEVERATGLARAMGMTAAAAVDGSRVTVELSYEIG